MQSVPSALQVVAVLMIVNTGEFSTEFSSQTTSVITYVTQCLDYPAQLPLPVQFRLQTHPINTTLELKSLTQAVLFRCNQPPV